MTFTSLGVHDCSFAWLHVWSKLGLHHLRQEHFISSRMVRLIMVWQTHISTWPPQPSPAPPALLFLTSLSLLHGMATGALITGLSSENPVGKTSFQYFQNCIWKTNMFTSNDVYPYTILIVGVKFHKFFTAKCCVSHPFPYCRHRYNLTHCTLCFKHL